MGVQDQASKLYPAFVRIKRADIKNTNKLRVKLQNQPKIELSASDGLTSSRRHDAFCFRAGGVFQMTRRVPMTEKEVQCDRI